MGNLRMSNRSGAQLGQALFGRRVIVFFNNLDLGGAECQGLVLARHLAREEHAVVEVWGFSGPGRVAESCDEAGIPWRVVPFQWGGSRLNLLVQLLRLIRTLRRARPDVLLPYTLPPNVVCGALWRFSGARACIWQQRDAGIGCCPAHLQRYAVRRTPQFIANSTTSAAFLTGELGVSPDEVNVIHNGVVLTAAVEGRESWRAKLGLRDADVVACMIANLHGNKDHDTLLRAWRLVLDQVPSNLPPPQLLLAGRFDGAELKLKALAFDLNLGSTVRFLGGVDDISGLLSAVDLGVFSSRREGCPNGILECMAAGLPVVATNVPGCREALGENANWLAEPGDYTGLGQNIVSLLKRPDLRAADAKSNQQRVREVFSADRMCRETVEVIRKVCSPPTA